MSFSAEWLALREPVDHASLNPDVRASLRARFAGRDAVSIVDLGCGAGSNLRGLCDALPARQDWRLVDHDPALLAAARLRLADWADAATEDDGILHLSKGARRLSVRFLAADLAAGDPEQLFDGADLATAAALFDLVSASRIEALAGAIAAAGCAFCTVLTYDGRADFTPGHPADATIREAFNADQRTDKGFGPAAGPDAAAALAAAFSGCGYRVLRGPSPWVVGSDHEALRRDLDAGFAAAAKAAGVDPAVAEAWLAHRLEGEDRVTTVGHEDLIALPV